MMASGGEMSGVDVAGHRHSSDEEMISMAGVRRRLITVEGVFARGRRNNSIFFGGTSAMIPNLMWVRRGNLGGIGKEQGFGEEQEKKERI